MATLYDKQLYVFGDIIDDIHFYKCTKYNRTRRPQGCRSLSYSESGQVLRMDSWKYSEALYVTCNLFFLVHLAFPFQWMDSLCNRIDDKK